MAEKRGVIKDFNMSAIECERCGYQTNTALCDWVSNIDTGKASRCYARWDDKKESWVKGCALNDKDADNFMKQFAEKQITRGIK